ncbi:MAG TPA: hypothetical protein VFO20_09680, partial [Propionibacteriaceae bacterium]|nr:hypothetical protein [Propionibacteriaceae bacterium]
MGNLPSGVLQARLARYAEAANCRAALLLLPSGDDFTPVASWLAHDTGATQARLLLETQLPAERRPGLRLPRTGLSLNALLEGQLYEDPAGLLRAAGLDPSLSTLPAEAAGVKSYAAIPLGPRASEGLVLLALAGTPQISELRRAARGLLDPHADSPPDALKEVGEALSVDLVRVYRLDDVGVCTVIGAWQSAGTLLPEAGESLSTPGTALQTVIESADSALVQTAARGDWLSTLSAAQGIRTVMFRPLNRDGRLCGLLELGSRRLELDLSSIEDR